MTSSRQQWLLMTLSAVMLTAGEEYCHNEEFVADCYDGDVILMTSGLYGRMAVGRCVKTDFGFVGCYKDVISELHERCSGRSYCSVRVPDTELDNTDPCHVDLKSYLQATYVCISVASAAADDTCQLRSEVNNASMYLSAGLPDSATPAPQSSSQCGSEAGRAWTVAVKPGQLINFTLIDLTPSRSRLHSCYVYVVLVERAVERVQLCTGQQANVSYTSTSNVVNVTLQHQLSNHVHYLLKYEAVGCPNVMTSQHMWATRNGDQLIAGCVTSQVTWTLSCVGNWWQGVSSNCSVVSANARREDGLWLSLSLGASILIIVAVSSAIGVVVLTFGLCYMKRGRCRRLGGAELPMRELKPLRTDTYDDTSNSVYARNNAFTQSQTATTAASGTGRLTATDSADRCEYEYVTRDGQAVGHTENRPDLVRLDRCQCGTVQSNGRYSNVDVKTHLLARKTSSEACSSNSSSSRDVTHEPVTSLRVCHHCGYASLTETVHRVSGAGMVAAAAPGSGTLPRRVVTGSTTTGQYSASVTLPRRHLIQPESGIHSPPPPLLPRKK